MNEGEMKDLRAIDRVQRTWPPTRLIDVTLRDGGFRTEFQWTLDEIITIAEACIGSGVDRVELGYIGGVPELHQVPNVGISADLTPGIVATVTSRIGVGKSCAMIHPTASPASLALDAYRDAGLDMVRIVYHHSWHNRFQDIAEQARAAGLSIAGNIALASRYHPDEFVRTAISISAFVDIVYLADTSGALLPAEVHHLAQRLKPLVEVGFHGHDYLSMALANSHAAALAGANWIDASVWGIGRGAGNLRLELWMALCQAHNSTTNVRLAELLPAINTIEARLGRPQIADLPAIVCGALNLTPPQEDELRSQASELAVSPQFAAAVLLETGSNGRSVSSALDASNIYRRALAKL
ncbi:hypothetical protein [Rhizobium leguminosarum]